MKVIIWIYANDLDKLINNKGVEYFEREPGTFEETIQVMVDTDAYQQLKDKRYEKNN